MVYYQIQNSHERIPIGKLICLARTYPKHAKEMQSEPPKEPLIFLKPESAVIFNNNIIVLPKITQSVHHEVELGVVIGKDGKNIPVGNASDYVFGYCVCLDITARDIQAVAKKNGWPWSIAKGFDTFAPISDVIEKKQVDDIHALSLQLQVNSLLRQQDDLSSMVFSVEEIIAHVSTLMTVKRGDLIMTGTPDGVAEIHHGDVLDASLGNICHLHVTVQQEQ